MAVARPHIERSQDRALQTTDWLHTNVENRIPDDGPLVDVLPRVAVTEALRHSLLVTNPQHLYWTN